VNNSYNQADKWPPGLDLPVEGATGSGCADPADQVRLDLKEQKALGWKNQANNPPRSDTPSNPSYKFPCFFMTLQDITIF